ncbi:uncharacterized protein LOC123215625 isoform X1 [Mangifera indica]|uniref:uncharacterized protein LOC123215625 isoform X1 n=1 Tax=Mangifera indica TaxID=29780 RepID=UPI001CFA0808|nr:uncharacterized protein LOC123215625 isoform X1 [Mangifera indica]XP_044491744.1 uncharacterized protein LOC123215625 isoform X1 [Mangifera indica]
MSDTNVEGLKEEEVAADSDSLQKQMNEDKCVQQEDDENHTMPSPHQEEEIIKIRYGGILPKKPPLISKDHERAFFDSADWALGKQGAQKPKGPLEALRPKLQPTPQQQVRSRRSAYAPAGEEEGTMVDFTCSFSYACQITFCYSCLHFTGERGGADNSISSEEDQSCATECCQKNNTASDENTSH